MNPLQLGASPVLCNALEEAQVQLSVSSCLPAPLRKPARSFTYGLLVKALKLVAITKASMEMGVLAELVKKRACSRTQYRSRRKRCASCTRRRVRETQLARLGDGECATPRHHLMAGLCCVEGHRAAECLFCFPDGHHLLGHVLLRQNADTSRGWQLAGGLARLAGTAGRRGRAQLGRTAQDLLSADRTRR